MIGVVVLHGLNIIKLISPTSRSTHWGENLLLEKKYNDKVKTEL